MFKKLLIITAQLFLLCSLNAQTTQSAENVLKTKISQINGFTAAFTQQVKDSQGKEIQSATGTVALKQPNQFIWQTLAPEESTLQSDGETIWYYDPFIEQVTALWLKDALLNNPVLLLLNVEDEVWQGYDVTQLNQDSFKIKVLDDKAMIDSIQVQFSANSSVVEQLIIADKQGQFSIYQFADFDANTTFKLGYFDFTLPADADLDDQRQ